VYSTTVLLLALVVDRTSRRWRGGQLSPGPAAAAPRSPTALAPRQPRKRRPQPTRTPRAGTLLWHVDW